MDTKVAADVRDLLFFSFAGAVSANAIVLAVAMGHDGHRLIPAFMATGTVVVLGTAIMAARSMVRIAKLDDQLTAMAMQDARSEATLLAREAMRNAVEAALDDA